ncbi:MULTISPECIES: hypothetical protein [Pseudomonadaceae]|jgi:hypothetical protein|uniref:Lipoprotein n=1 Tax=Ectopseudomonas hydrolytica TaxID=2493633 RepID=A0ABY5A6A7_9GAMM|nr:MULTISPECIES: hypothetical protein [Pseudomonas]ARS50392.1 lipoprotein [Pseudomonas mendocina]MBF8163874.1 hypothetical protein [Pseudomonas mendocina]MDH0095028.1 hypothetical protein [Pseudomonas sp. GD04158]USR38926.1 hypothetical protein L1F06_019985 [Pseudomonas hydrolytica]UTH32731.1 hypothetical protein NLY38_05290 [Pseudomonas hydrolytica]
MKKFASLVSFTLLGACANLGSQPPVPVTSPVVQAFRDICLQTAPSFAEAHSVARQHGVSEVTDMGFATIGFNADKSLGIQVKAGHECVVTSEVQEDATLTRQLLTAAAVSAGTTVPSRVPVKMMIAGQQFILMHDRKGGEAFVMLKPE